jgi:hypothetical protein
MTTPDGPVMRPRDHARLVLARDRALAAVLSRNSAASLADACPGLGPGVDPTLWLCSEDPDRLDDMDRLLAYRVAAARRELLELVGELSRCYDREAIATAMRLPAFGIDEMLDDLAYDQRHQLQRAAEIAGLHDRMRRWLTGENRDSDADSP